MNAELIFYLSDKTNLNQEQLEKNLHRYGVSISNVSFATDYNSFDTNIKKALRRSNMIFIIGGLLKLGETNTIRVLSKSLTIPLDSDYPPILKGSMLLGNMNFNNGCIIESETQSITVLPDNPYSIRSVFSGKLENFLMKKYFLVDMEKERALAVARKSLRSEKSSVDYENGEKVILSPTTINEILQTHNIDIDLFSDDTSSNDLTFKKVQAPTKKPRHQKNRKLIPKILLGICALLLLSYVVIVSVIAFPTVKTMLINCWNYLLQITPFL